MTSISQMAQSSLVKRNNSHVEEAKTFPEKVLELQTVILPSLPPEQQVIMNSLLDELTEIYFTDLSSQRLKMEKQKQKECSVNTKLGEGMKVSQKEQKTLLEVREGRRLKQEIIVGQRRRSPEKKQVGAVRFEKFMPKKVGEKQKGATLGGRLKGKEGAS